MKILLVATNRERSPYPVTPVGVLCVAGAARAAGHDVDFLDLGVAASPDEALISKLKSNDYKAVGLGVRNLDNCWAFAPHVYYEEVRQVVDTVRRNYKGPLIVGGSGFSVEPHGWMKRIDVDCGIVGEGERAFVEVLSRLEAGQSVEGIPGVLTSPKAGVPVNALAAQSIKNLAELPAAAHDLCDYRQYLRHGGAVGVQTKRGCPLGCVYCIYPQLEGCRYRLRPPELVVDEIENVYKRHGSRYFFFVDSVFNDPRRHALAVCKEITRRRLPVHWTAFCNPLGFDEEVARAMAEAGCNGVEFGQDVATSKMLEALGKPFTQEQTRVAMKAAHDAKLPFVVYLLFGGPGETWADVEETQKFLDGCAPANGVFASYGIRVYAGTELARIAVNEGVMRADQDLFEPVYYISKGLSENTVANLDRIARQRPEWSSPADWRRPIMLWAQKVNVMLNIRPQWKHVRGYGQFMRRFLK